MHRLPALLGLLLLACGFTANAQSPIHRCIGADGGAVFTDQPCSALQATPITAKAPQSAIAPGAPPPVLCARDKGALRQSVIEAFAGGDANRLAGLMLWDGYGRGAAITDIRSLASLMKQPLLGVEISGGSPPAPASSADDPFADMAPPVLVPADERLLLDVAGGDGRNPRTLSFTVVRQAGCLWLRATN